MKSRLPNVIMVAGRVPEPIRSGLDLRVRAQLCALSRAFNVTLVAVAATHTPVSHFPVSVETLEVESDTSEPEFIHNLLRNPEEPYGSLFNVAAASRLQNLIGKLTPSATIISRLENWIYAGVVRAASPAPVILDLDESADRLLQSFPSLPYQGIARSLHLRFTRSMALYEHAARCEADAIWVSSPIEKEFLQDTAVGLPPVHVVVNAVDIPEDHLGKRMAERPSIIFTGTFAYPPNLYASQEIIQHIAPMLPGAKFVLAGSHAPKAIRESVGENVTVISPVSDMHQLMLEADISLLPIRAGGGTRFKALEAMAQGVPCIGTRVAFEGLGVQDRQHVILAETPSEFIDAIHQVLADRQLREAVTRRAKAHVRGLHSIPALTDGFSRFFTTDDFTGSSFAHQPNQQ